jgi:hypothetical protein
MRRLIDITLYDEYGTKYILYPEESNGSAHEFAANILSGEK